MMDFGLTEAQQRLRDEVTAFCRAEGSPELFEEGWWNEMIGPVGQAFKKKLAARGWIAPSWPQEYGGLGLSKVDAAIIVDTLCYEGCALMLTAAALAGPTIMRFGNDEQKRRLLPPIARGEVEYALGYTEPQAGSDLAAIGIRAVDDGDDFIISGQKTFNTACHFSDYHWLCCRTELDKPRHEGLSLLVVDLKSPGIDIRPLWTMMGTRTNEVFYDSVRVPKTNLIGKRGKGFTYVALALEYERSQPAGILRKVHDELVQYARDTVANGRPLIEDPVVRHKIAELAADIDVLQMYVYQLAWLQDQGLPAGTMAAAAKTVNSETSAKLAYAAKSILGPFAQLARGSEWAPCDGRFEHRLLVQVVETIWAGTNEIQRNIIAQRGLGLPRA